jgi:hypothetical protein
MFHKYGNLWLREKRCGFIILVGEAPYELQIFPTELESMQGGRSTLASLPSEKLQEGSFALNLIAMSPLEKPK